MENFYSAKQVIENVPEKLLEQIDNIAANMGITRSQFLRQQLRNIANNYSDEMKNSFDPDMNKKEILLRNLDPHLKSNIKNISKNIGVSQTGFIKMELQKIINTFPADMKRPPLDY